MKHRWFTMLALIAAICLAGGVLAPAQAAAPVDWSQIPFQKDGNTGIHTLEVFKGSLYASTQNYDTGLRIWRMGDNQTWTPVSEAGFGNPLLSDVMDLMPFKGMLYASAGDYNERTAGQMWRSADGATWEAVTTDAFGEENVPLLGKFAIFNDQLYVAAHTNTHADWTSDGVQIWRSASGAAGSWERVVNEGMGDTLANGITSLIVFKDALYAVVETDWNHPTRLWRTFDGANWTVVFNDGFGDPFNYSSGGAAVFQDYLYVGTVSQDINTVNWGDPAANPSPSQIWRSKDGLTWEVVVKDGFGDWTNYKLESLYVFEGQLYAGTWSVEWVNFNWAGAQIYRSPDGVNWTLINTHGFGDPHNWATHLSVDVTAYQGSLYYGTLNPQGGQIWKLSQ